jgi:hypothetical protein
LIAAVVLAASAETLLRRAGQISGFIRSGFFVEAPRAGIARMKETDRKRTRIIEVYQFTNSVEWH